MYLCFGNGLLCFLFWCCDSYKNIKLSLHVRHCRGFEYEGNWCIPYNHPSHLRMYSCKNFSIVFVKNSLSIIIFLEVLVQRYSDHKFIFIYVILCTKEKKDLYLPSAVLIAHWVLVVPSKQLKQIIQTENNIVKKPNWPEANHGCLQAWPRIWIRGFRETNPGSGQSGTRTQDCWLASPRCWPIGHAAYPATLSTL